MQLSNYIILAAVEVYIVLFAISIFMFLHLRKQNRLLRRQQVKLQELIAELKKLRLPPAAAQVTGNTYKTHIHAQLAATRNHYAGLAPAGDITEAQAPDSTPSQKALALRYQFLQLENSAIAKGDGPLKINWLIFENALETMQLQQVENNNSEETANLKKRVENLEKFKKLFFDMEQQWQDAKKQAQDYYQQLREMANNVDDTDSFIDLLESYHNVYSDIDGGFKHANSVASKSDLSTAPNVITVTRIDPRAGDEIIKLRNVAADQHRIISQLQKKLEEAVTAEAKEMVINELQQQLQRQVRFVQESETCIQLLEDELSAAGEKLNRQQKLLDIENSAQQENIRLKETLLNFSHESKQLIASIINLEQENEHLKINPKQSETIEAASVATRDSETLHTIRAELLALQGQYAELEEKYLDLRLKR